MWRVKATLIVGGNDIKSGGNRPAISFYDPTNGTTADVECKRNLKVDGNIIQDSDGYNTIQMKGGGVGFGWGDTSLTYVPKAVFQVGASVTGTRGLVFHANAGSPFIGFNTYYDVASSSMKYLNDGAAARIMLDQNNPDRLQINTIVSGSKDASVTSCGLGISISTSTGNVGIRTVPAADVGLNVNGGIKFENTTDPEPWIPLGLYAHDGSIYVQNLNWGWHQNLTSYRSTTVCATSPNLFFRFRRCPAILIPS